MKQDEVPDSARNRKGVSFISSKSKNAKLLHVYRLSIKVNYVVQTEKDKLQFVLSTALPLDTKNGAGKIIIKDKIKDVYPFCENK